MILVITDVRPGYEKNCRDIKKDQEKRIKINMPDNLVCNETFEIFW